VRAASNSVARPIAARSSTSTAEDLEVLLDECHDLVVGPCAEGLIVDRRLGIAQSVAVGRRLFVVRERVVAIVVH
jgi:hypothetical protein